jgi:hypothetical protein
MVVSLFVNGIKNIGNPMTILLKNKDLKIKKYS